MGKADARCKGREAGGQTEAGRKAGRQSCVRESEMAPRIARETKRVWSINVKREEGGVLAA